MFSSSLVMYLTHFKTCQRPDYFLNYVLTNKILEDKEAVNYFYDVCNAS